MRQRLQEMADWLAREYDLEPVKVHADPSKTSVRVRVPWNVVKHRPTPKATVGTMDGFGWPAYFTAWAAAWSSGRKRKAVDALALRMLRDLIRRAGLPDYFDLRDEDGCRVAADWFRDQGDDDWAEACVALASKRRKANR